MNLRYVLFKVRTACTECGDPLILDGPLRSVQCLACQSTLDLGMQWKRILEFREKDEVRKRVESVVLGFASEFTFHLRMGPEAPKCAQCNHPLDLANFALGTDGEIACSCGHATPTFPTPSWLRDLYPSAAQVFNGAREGADHKAPVTPQADRPVSFGCPDCGANLKITMESPRILECRFCKADLFLPDPLWRALHPVKKRSAWYIAFTGAKANPGG